MTILDKHHIKDYALKTIAILVDPDANEKYEEATVKAKCMILDRVKDHVILLLRSQQQGRCGRP